jgi:cytidylate kinase
VRVWAPLAVRISFIAQRHGLSRPEAERHVAERDAGRREYMLGNFGVDPLDPSRYDLSLNAESFGAERCAELIAAAARARLPAAG